MEKYKEILHVVFVTITMLLLIIGMMIPLFIFLSSDPIGQQTAFERDFKKRQSDIEEEKRNFQKDLQTCRDAGGIPKMSFFGGRIMDCIKVEQHE